MERFFTKETLAIIALVIYTLIQSNYFATKLDLANLRIEILKNQKVQNQEIENLINKKFKEQNENIEKKFEKIIGIR